MAEAKAAETAAKENVTAAAHEVAAARERYQRISPCRREDAPGFESIFSLTGLLAVAYLVLGRRE